MTIAEIISSILLIVATVMVIATAIALWRAPDALTRVNLLGPTVGLAVPLLLVAKLVVDFAEKRVLVVVANPSHDCMFRRVDHRVGGFFLYGAFDLRRDRHRREVRQAYARACPNG